MRKKLIRYLKIWLLMTRNSFLGVLSQRLGVLVFLLGKILRFGFFVAFIVYLLKGTGVLAGYTLNQTLFFFLTFNLVDAVAQFLFREVYRFRPLVVSGDLDLILVKPVNPLFRVLLGGADVIDLVTLPFLFVAVYYIGSLLGPTPIQTIAYFLLIANGLLIATAFHILVLGLGIITLEIDHTIMIYRDIVNLGRFPIDIYKQPVRALVMYFIPVGVMITFPAKVFIGILSLQAVLISLALGAGFLVVSLKFWNFAMTKYTSASS